MKCGACQATIPGEGDDLVVQAGYAKADGSVLEVRVLVHAMVDGASTRLCRRCIVFAVLSGGEIESGKSAEPLTPLARQSQVAGRSEDPPSLAPWGSQGS